MAISACASAASPTGARSMRSSRSSRYGPVGATSDGSAATARSSTFRFSQSGSAPGGDQYSHDEQPDQVIRAGDGEPYPWAWPVGSEHCLVRGERQPIADARSRSRSGSSVRRCCRSSRQSARRPRSPRVARSWSSAIPLQATAGAARPRRAPTRHATRATARPDPRAGRRAPGRSPLVRPRG